MSYIPVCLTDPLTQSNCYIITSGRHALLIDPNDGPMLSSYIEEHDLQPETVLLTHEHCDHIAGLNLLRRSYTLQVIASRPCSDGLQSAKRNMSRIMETYLYFKSNGTLRVSYPRFVCKAADLTFEETFCYDWYGFHFTLIAAPGHTPGSTCIILDRDILFSGDYFIPGEEVVTRLPGSDDTAYESTGKAILRTLPVPIWTYPGHGAPFMLTEDVKHKYGL
jgi:glyoxylase-like metal-dependent hydrolase (beta-lactamase superfamily II)